MKDKLILGGVAVIAILGLFFPTVSGQLGNATASFWQATYFDATSATVNNTLDGGVTVGTSGTGIDRINTGFCTIFAPANTIAATTTQEITCHGGTSDDLTTLTGITAGDVCFLGQATTSAATTDLLYVQEASASTTAGYILGTLVNPGPLFTWTAAASSSWPYACYDPT